MANEKCQKEKNPNKKKKKKGMKMIQPIMSLCQSPSKKLYRLPFGGTNRDASILLLFDCALKKLENGCGGEGKLHIQNGLPQCILLLLLKLQINVKLATNLYAMGNAKLDARTVCAVVVVIKTQAICWLKNIAKIWWSTKRAWQFNISVWVGIVTT